jgi:hypothetical protein
MTEQQITGDMNKKTGIYIMIAALVLLGLSAGSILLTIYVDWLFFSETGYVDVFSTIIYTKLLSGVIFGAIFLVFYIPNIILANKANFPLRNLHIFGDTGFPVKTFSVDRSVKIASLIGGVVIAVLVSFYGASRWDEILFFINRINVGKSDPVFGRDIGFYLFSLPFVETMKSFAALTLVLTAVVTTANYFLRGGVAVSERSIALDPQTKKHLCLFGLFGALIVAAGFYIDAIRLLFSPHSFIYGAGYTDIYAKYYTYIILTVMSAVTGLAFIVSLLKRSFRFVSLAAAATAIIYVAGIVIYAPLLQKLKVAPNELDLEKPFIQHNIEFTRFGYDLDRIELQSFDVAYDLDRSDIERNDATIKNIRLWDNKPLLRTYSQLQQIRTYYRFTDVDNDRYTINGQYRQVMLSPRELSYNDLPSKSWINERLVFTHGNGIAMGPVSRITKEGLPEFIIKDIPPVSSADIQVTRPEIYYGEIPNDYVIVKTKVQEFNYPTASKNVYSKYEGTGGVKIGSIFRRSILAMKYNTAKFLLSTDLSAESRILFYRNIRERVSKIAPFLLFDSDPYMVVSSDGRLYWMIDCYTVSGNMPYSMPINGKINYIRNSVKAVIDAYNGDVSFYISDPDDIIVKVLSRAFGTLFRPLSDMPSDLRLHIRYPQGMLEVQARMFALYHMTDPKVFYNKEDLWEIPSYSDKAMEPYNTIMKLPGEKKEEYILLIPYTPSKRDNLAAWLAARCDEPNYGRLIAYVFPRDRLVFGPRQVNARIDQDAYISQQITLWGQVGSQVIRGSLLVIPIEDSLLYVQPLYLSASDRVGLPELRRVIVAYEKNVVMEENLEMALRRLFYGKEKQPETDRKISGKVVEVRPGDLVKEAVKAYEEALQMQREGDWSGYGERIKRLGELLRRIQEKTGH